MSGTPIGMGATLIGGAVKAWGDYQAAAAKGAEYTADATTQAQLASAEKQAADVTEYAGFRAAENVGMQYRAAVGRQAVTYGAANIGGATPGLVRGSQIALGQQAQREALAKYQETAYQERIRGAEETAASQRYAMAAGAARREGEFAVAGDVLTALGSAAGQAAQQTSVTGDSSSVNPKWLPDSSGGVTVGSDLTPFIGEV